MSSEWVDDNINDVFVLGEWSVASGDKFVNITHITQNIPFVVTHICHEALKVHPDPWVWQSQLYIPCPDCGVKCPDEVITVFEMLK
jgi:hypothetical protein